MISSRDRAVILGRMRHAKRFVDQQQLNQLIRETEGLLRFLLDLHTEEPNMRRLQVLEDAKHQLAQNRAIGEQNLQLIEHTPEYDKIRILDKIVSRMDNDPVFHQQLVSALSDITGADLQLQGKGN